MTLLAVAVLAMADLMVMAIGGTLLYRGTRLVKPWVSPLAFPRMLGWPGRRIKAFAAWLELEGESRFASAEARVFEEGLSSAPRAKRGAGRI